MWIFFIKKSALWGSGLIFFKYYKEIAYSQICGNFNWNCRQIVRNGMKGKVTTLYGSSWVLSKF